MSFLDRVDLSFLDDVDLKAFERELELDELERDIAVDAVIRSLENGLRKRR
jgi:hypothetical protein